eukprot:TRINITY_DN8906_c0_g1_i10.p1 TRINITY_DN8906_c0_g1~~TRINITY_DN8906_c0_g1_i10.p1  ORF type:complete len:299 (-),score=60.13 TRINITY_DN8906_c0_g1_i10:166-1062(-)
MMASSSNIVLTFNVLGKLYRSLGFRPYETAYNLLREQGLNVLLLPIVNHSTNTITERSNYISRHLPHLLEKNGLSGTRVHVIAHSLAGLDMRYFLTKEAGSKYVKTLITLGTPHGGSYLADCFDSKKIGEDHIEPLSRALGVPYKSFAEVNPKNMFGFNMTTLNAANVHYFSIGGEKDGKDIADVFKYTQNFIKLSKELHLRNDNDGVFAVDEVRWGTHMVNFYADHSELMSVGAKSPQVDIFKFLGDHVQQLDKDERQGRGFYAQKTPQGEQAQAQVFLCRLVLMVLILTRALHVFA